MNFEKEILLWKTRYEKEKKARRESEILLEKRSQKLCELNHDLEEEVKKRTLSLEKLLEELKEADESKSNFLANISHELKTPLNAINILSNVMISNKKGNLTPQDLKNLKIISKSGKFLVDIINDILDISKLEIGELDIFNEKLVLKDIMQDIHDMIFPQAIEKNLNMIFSFDDNIDFIFSDEKRLKQIVKNLLSNSLKFTENGMISFIILDDNSNFKIIVEDQGIGMPEDKIANIFDKFKQIDDGISRKKGGTGLGLAICKELVLLLKGDIKVSSELGVGTIFEVTLPKNTHLLKGYDMINLDFDSRHSDNFGSFDFFDTLNNNIENESIESIYLINSNPIKFLKIVNEFKKRYEIISIKDIKDIDFTKSLKVILESSVIKKDDISYIKNKNIDLIVIGKNSVYKELDNFVILNIEEPSSFDYSLI